MSDPNPAPPRFLTREAYQRLFSDIRAMASPGGGMSIHLASSWQSDVRWLRNRILKAGDWRTVDVLVHRYAQGDQDVVGTAGGNQIDPASLRQMVHWAEQMCQQFDGRSLAAPAGTPAYGGPILSTYAHDEWSKWDYPATHIWSDETYAQSQDTRMAIAVDLMSQAEAAGMLSAGYLSVGAQGYVVELDDGGFLYAPATTAQCSITVHDPASMSSGWAGRSSHDWGRIDAEKLAAVALDKCLRGRNPVRIEPGRYTVILEPQAIYDLLAPRINWVAFRLPPAVNNMVWPTHDGATPTRTKLGERMVDERLNLSFDPLDPDLGGLPFTPTGYPVRPVRWITNGALTELSYDAGMTREEMQALHTDVDPVGRVALGWLRLDGGTHPPTSLDEMIATTERGLLVTRFANVIDIDQNTGLMHGTTRDGLWLIERGKIASAVMNLVFTDSWVSAFNRVEQIGTAVPIFNPGVPALTAPMKIREFNFTGISSGL